MDIDREMFVGIDFAECGLQCPCGQYHIFDKTDIFLEGDAQKKPPLSDHKLEQIASLNFREQWTDRSLVNLSELSQVAQAFDWNLRRVEALVMFPLQVFYYSLQGGWLRARGAWEVLQKFEIANESEDKQVLLHVEKLVRGDGGKQCWILGKNYNVFTSIDELSKTMKPPGMKALQAILASYLTGVWTAVETMTGDLWERAVNARPHGLSRLRGAWKEQPSPDPAEEPSRVPGEEGTVPVRLLEKYKYNVGNRMGTLLRDARKVGFTRLDDIRNAYKLAFWKDYQEIKVVVNSRSLFVLSVLRNVLVHKGGIADEEFRNKMKRDDRFNGIALGEPLRLDGEIVAGVVASAVTDAKKLISAVDKWLTDNPGKQNA